MTEQLTLKTRERYLCHLLPPTNSAFMPSFGFSHHLWTAPLEKGYTCIKQIEIEKVKQTSPNNICVVWIKVLACIICPMFFFCSLEKLFAFLDWLSEYNKPDASWLFIPQELQQAGNKPLLSLYPVRHVIKALWDLYDPFAALEWKEKLRPVDEGTLHNVRISALHLSWEHGCMGPWKPVYTGFHAYTYTFAKERKELLAS